MIYITLNVKLSVLFIFRGKGMLVERENAAIPH